MASNLIWRFSSIKISAPARNGQVKLTARALGVVMALGHEVLIADKSRLNEGSAPKQTAFVALRDGMKRLYAVNDHILRQILARLLVTVAALQVAHRAYQELDLFAEQFSRAKVNTDWHDRHRDSSPHKKISFTT